MSEGTVTIDRLRVDPAAAWFGERICGTLVPGADRLHAPVSWCLHQWMQGHTCLDFDRPVAARSAEPRAFDMLEAPVPDEWMRARQRIGRALRKLPRPARPTQATFTGGTAHAYACLLRKKNVKARRLENFPIRREELVRLILRLLPLSAREIARIPGMPEDRVTVALPAFLVLAEAVERLNLSRIRVSTHGLRYGVWLAYLAAAPIRRIVR